MAETPTSRRWRRIVAEQLESGLSVQAFAQSKNVTAGTLSWRKARLRMRDSEAAAGSRPQFTALTVAEPTRTIVLALEDHRAHVVIDQQTDLALLRRVLEPMA
jgi:transposase-like protein